MSIATIPQRKQYLLGLLLCLPMVGISIFWVYCLKNNTHDEIAELRNIIAYGLSIYVPFALWNWWRLKNRLWREIERRAESLPFQFVMWWAAVALGMFVCMTVNVFMNPIVSSPTALSRGDYIIHSGFLAFGTWAFPAMFAYPVAWIYYRMVLQITRPWRQRLLADEL